ncbi:hypothetical protein ACEPPN_010003 [Leptodophora sp. 'Broadleaf-Isolate-01']
MAIIKQVTWIIAVITVAFCVSSFGNGANDVSNSYATTIASNTLSMKQAGGLAVFTEFSGAVVLGGDVTETIKNGVINITHFDDSPDALVLAMGCVEFGSAAWLTAATYLGLPISTTQTVVGSLAGVGFASGAPVNWSWLKIGLSQIAASWIISPFIACVIAVLFQWLMNVAFLNRKDTFKWARRFAPLIFALTCTLLAVFVLVDLLDGQSVMEFGIGKFSGSIIGTFLGALALWYMFASPYIHRSLAVQDPRLRLIHIPMGPLLLYKNPPYYFPADETAPVTNDPVSQQPDGPEDASLESPAQALAEVLQDTEQAPSSIGLEPINKSHRDPNQPPPDREGLVHSIPVPAREKYLTSTEELPLYKPARLWAWFKYLLCRGVSQECVTFNSTKVNDAHTHSKKHDSRAEELWKPLQIVSAMMMSIAHGSNDVSNAVAPWVSAYATWRFGFVSEAAETPIWTVCAAAILIGAGFWFFGYKVVRSLGNKITFVSPTRGFVINMATSVTVLVASKLGIPVSTTQCQLGATIGVGLSSFDTKAINWKQIGFIVIGWILTLPIAGLVSGSLMLMALNTPHMATP